MSSFYRKQTFSAIKKMNKKMDAKKILVSLFAIASILLLAASATAVITNDAIIKVDDVIVATYNGAVTLVDSASVIAGETATVKVEFTALANASNVKLRAELEGIEGSVTAVTPLFDVEAGKTYVKTLTIKVPSVDKDSVNEVMTLNLRLWNSGSETEVSNLLVNVQREAYTAKVVSVNVDSSLKAGENFPVEVVVRNTGYNDLEDVYVTVKIDALGIAKTVYFGNIVNVDNVDSSNDLFDTVRGIVSLTLPFDVKEGKYNLEVVIKNDDSAPVTQSQEVFVANGFPEEVIKVANGLLLVNPSNELRMYKIVTPSSETIESVQAGTSKTVSVNATSTEYTVTVLRLNGEVVGTFTFESTGQQLIVNGSPVVVLTAILAVVFLILVVVLVVLMTKKPKKSEDSESYY